MNSLIFFTFICSKGYDLETRIKCTQVIKSTIEQVELYQSLRSKEKEYRDLAEAKLTKTGFWVLLTGISTASTGKIELTGHNVMGIDALNLSISDSPKISATWSF